MTTTIDDIQVSPAGQQFPRPIQEGQQHVYLHAGPFLFELQAVSHTAAANLEIQGAPASLLLGNVSDPRLRVRVPIPVRIVREGNTFVASFDAVDEFGYGQNRSEALEDLAKSIAALYFSLAAQNERLGEDLKSVRSRLDQYLERRLSR